MFGLHEHVNNIVLHLTLQHGDVMVRTSWWRRWRGTEEWGVAHRYSLETHILSVKTGERIPYVGQMKQVEDPDKWPDEVCAIVARLKLEQ